MWKLSVGRKYLEMKDISLTLHNLFSIQIIKFEKWAPKKITSWCKRGPSRVHLVMVILSIFGADMVIEVIFVGD